jgi:hypothetical protein
LFPAASPKTGETPETGESTVVSSLVIAVYCDPFKLDNKLISEEPGVQSYLVGDSTPVTPLVLRLVGSCGLARLR